jgi:hypothetical protein
MLVHYHSMDRRQFGAVGNLQRQQWQRNHNFVHTKDIMVVKLHVKHSIGRHDELHSRLAGVNSRMK